MALTPTELIEQFQQKDDTYRIRISNKPEDDIIVKTVRSVSELAAVNAKAAMLLKIGKTPPDVWKPFLPVSQETATVMAELTCLVVTPKFEDLDALKLCAQAGALASYLHLQIMMQYQKGVPEYEAEAVEMEKNA